MSETNVARILSTFPQAEQWYDAIPKELKMLGEQIKKRLKDQKDLVIALTGHEEGIGKSSTAILLAWLEDMENFDLVNNIAYISSAEKIKKQFWEIKQESSFILDEAIKALYKMDFNSALQKMLVTMYATERWQRKATFICIPRFTDLAEQFRNHKVKLWIKLMKRGYGVVHVKDPDDYSDPWKLEFERKYRERNWKGKKVVDITFSERMEMERKKSTFLMEFRIPELPKPVFETYEEIKRAQHTEDAEQETDSTRVLKLKENIFKLCKYIKEGDKGMSVNRLSQISGLSDTALREVINRFGTAEDFKKTPKRGMA